MSFRQYVKRGLCGIVCLLLCLTAACGEGEQPTISTAATTTSAVSTTASTTMTTAPSQVTASTTAPTQATSAVTQPADLTAWLSMQNVEYTDLSDAACTQLIVVSTDTEGSRVHFFECDGELWREQDRMTAVCHVGKNGVTSHKTEGDGCTPRGLYAIGDAFYFDTAPRTGLSSFAITQDTYWVDDPDSRYYNQRVEGTAHKDWNSAEHMIDYEVYRYGFVIKYNSQAAYNIGSAIFFHIGDQPTLGCVSADEETVLQYLSALQAERCPFVLIV